MFMIRPGKRRMNWGRRSSCNPPGDEATPCSSRRWATARSCWIRSGNDAGRISSAGTPCSRALWMA